ncbi:hypothetical protein Tco_1017974 [Tanacetum coccineum]|uniref:Uncharacterized protein n=1 Tax=Tanacetum coccineum TaxID=301880 RepID=A0ABQ5FTI1_9ASTR
MLDEGDNWGINPLEFISRVNLTFEIHKKVDGRTKKESDYGNPPNTTTDSFFKPYLKAQENNDIEKEDERSQKKRKSNKGNLEINNEQPNKKDLAGKEIDKVGEVSII